MISPNVLTFFFPFFKFHGAFDMMDSALFGFLMFVGFLLTGFSTNDKTELSFYLISTSEG